MEKFYFFVLIIFLSFSNNSIIKKYNVDDLFLKQIDLTDRTACICFKLDDNLSKDSTFYIYAQTDNGYARINKTIHYNRLKNKLDDDFIIIFDAPNPDYLIYNVYTDEDIHPNYSNSNTIRIANYLENAMPDLNYADYAFGHYHITIKDWLNRLNYIKIYLKMI